MSYMSYGEACEVSREISDCESTKARTIAEEIERLSETLMKLSQMLNALCGNMAGADNDSPKELANAPLLARLDMINGVAGYCTERAETLLKIMGQ